MSAHALSSSLAAALFAGAADGLPAGRNNDAERYLRRTRCRRQVAGTSVTGQRSRPDGAPGDVDPPLDGAERLVHDAAARDSLLVVQRARRPAQPHHARRPASRQSTHGPTQRPRRRTAEPRLAQDPAQSRRQQPQPSTTVAKHAANVHASSVKTDRVRRDLDTVACIGKSTF